MICPRCGYEEFRALRTSHKEDGTIRERICTNCTLLVNTIEVIKEIKCYNRTTLSNTVMSLEEYQERLKHG